MNHREEHFSVKGGENMGGNMGNLFFPNLIKENINSHIRSCQRTPAAHFYSVHSVSLSYNITDYKTTLIEDKFKSESPPISFCLRGERTKTDDTFFLILFSLASHFISCYHCIFLYLSPQLSPIPSASPLFSNQIGMYNFSLSHQKGREKKKIEPARQSSTQKKKVTKGFD